jgi:hypothetical protein
MEVGDTERQSLTEVLKDGNQNNQIRHHNNDLS